MYVIREWIWTGHAVLYVSTTYLIKYFMHLLQFKSSLLLQEAHSKECTASTNSTIQGLNIQEVIKSVHSTSSLIL